MDNAKAYLLKAIVGHEKNGFSTFGSLNAKHVDDLAKLMTDFATDSFLECIDRLNKGETINFNGHVVSFTVIKKRKRKSHA